MKVLWFDTETTGLDPVKNDIIQIAGIVEIDGDVKEEFNIKCQPINYDTISQDALKVHGISIDQLKTFQTSKDGKNEFLKIMDKYVDKFNKDDKFTPAGQNVQFDVNMLREWFIKNGERFGSGSYHNYHMIDTVTLARTMSYEKVFHLENHKLETLAKRYSIEIDAHNALSDIRATREVYKSLINEFTNFCKNK
jgi:DNA polymerase-3 subunit epsilon